MSCVCYRCGREIWWHNGGWVPSRPRAVEYCPASRIGLPCRSDRQSAAYTTGACA